VKSLRIDLKLTGFSKWFPPMCLPRTLSNPPSTIWPSPHDPHSLFPFSVGTICKGAATELLKKVASVPVGVFASQRSGRWSLKVEEEISLVPPGLWRQVETPRQDIYSVAVLPPLLLCPWRFCFPTPRDDGPARRRFFFPPFTPDS